MEKSVLYITNIMRHQKQVLTTSYKKNIEGTVFVKLLGLNIENFFFYTQLPLNEDDTNFEEQVSDINYKNNNNKLHVAGWENSYFTYAYVSMLGYGCAVSQYPQFFDKYLDTYQMLPRPFIGYFGGFLGDKLIIKKLVFEL